MQEEFKKFHGSAPVQFALPVVFGFFTVLFFTRQMAFTADLLLNDRREKDVPKLLVDLILNNWLEYDMHELLLISPPNLEAMRPLILRVMCHWYQMSAQFLFQDKVDVKVIAQKQALVVPKLEPKLFELVARSHYINWNLFAEWIQVNKMTANFVSTQIIPRHVPLDDEIIRHHGLTIVRTQNLRNVLSSPDWSAENLHTIWVKLRGQVDPSQILEYQNVPNVLSVFDESLEFDLCQWLRRPHPYQEMPLELLEPKYFNEWFYTVPDFFQLSGCSLEFCTRFAQLVELRTDLCPDLVTRHLQHMCNYQYLSEDFVICFRHLNLIQMASRHVRFSRKILRYWKQLDLEYLFDANDGVDDTLIELLYCPRAMAQNVKRNNVRVARYFAQHESPIWGVAKFDKANFEPANVLYNSKNTLCLKQISAINYLEQLNQNPTRVVSINLQEEGELLRQVVRLDLVRCEALRPQIVANFLPCIVEAARFGCLSDDVLRHLILLNKIDLNMMAGVIEEMTKILHRLQVLKPKSLFEQLVDNMVRYQILPPEVVAELVPAVFAKSGAAGVVTLSHVQNVRSPATINILGTNLIYFLEHGWYSSQFVDMCFDIASELLVAGAARIRNFCQYTFNRAQLSILFPDKQSSRDQLRRWNLGGAFEWPIDVENFVPSLVRYFTPKEAHRVVDCTIKTSHKEVQKMLKRCNCVDEEYLYLVKQGAALCIMQTWDDQLELRQYFESNDRNLACAELYMNNTFSSDFCFANPNVINWLWFFRFSPHVTVDLVRAFANPNRGDLDALMQNPHICLQTLQEMHQIWPDLRWPRLRIKTFLSRATWS